MWLQTKNTIKLHHRKKKTTDQNSWYGRGGGGGGGGGGGEDKNYKLNAQCWRISWIMKNYKLGAVLPTFLF